jgi:type 1 glutamine amidotransferase
MLSKSGILAMCLAACGMLLSPLAARAADEKPIKALFICGGCCHDYLHQKDIITKGISARAPVEWTIAYDPDKTTHHLNPIYNNPDWYKGFDVIVHDECTADFSRLDPKNANDPAKVKQAADELAVVNNVILKPHKDGVPAVVLHCAMHSYRSEGWPKAVTPWYELTGVRTTAHGSQLPIAITFTDKENPITKGLSDWTTIHEELYNNQFGLLDTVHPLAHGKQTYKDRKTGQEKTDDDVVVWTNIYNGKTKVFGTTIGHNNETCDDPRYLDLVTRGLLWTLGREGDFHAKPVNEASAQR